MNTNPISVVRAEVERLKEENVGGTWEWINARCEAYNNVLAKLSDLEKSEKPINPTIEKLRALIKIQIRREELNFAALGGGGQTFCINTLEWVLKQLDTLQEQPVKDFPTTDKEMADFLATHKPVQVPEKYKTPDWMFEKEEKPNDGLEEEISRYLREECSNDDEPSISEVARHFAKWGAEHLKS